MAAHTITRSALLRQVATDALIRGAPGAAVAWLRRAMAEPPPEDKRIAVLLELGGAELRLGTPAAIEHLSAAVEAIDEPELLAVATRQLALALSISGNSDDAVRALESTIDRLQPADPAPQYRHRRHPAMVSGPHMPHRIVAARKRTCRPDIAVT